MSNIPHKAGFVSIIGKPNVGKSTLMNALCGERLSIITQKLRLQGIELWVFGGITFKSYSDTPL